MCHTQCILHLIYDVRYVTTPYISTILHLEMQYSFTWNASSVSSTCWCCILRYIIYTGDASIYICSQLNEASVWQAGAPPSWIMCIMHMLV